MTQPRVIDWFRVIVDLGRAGMSYRALAEAVGVSKSTIENWAGDVEPRHADGERLLALWGDLTGRPTSEAPRKILVVEFVQETGQLIDRECMHSHFAR